MSRARRGRLSKIDLLPEEAEPYVAAALIALKERKRTQEDIREELNLHLMSMGEKPISRGAFNRKAMWLAGYGHQLQQAREIAAIMAEKLDDAPKGDVGLLLNETIKMLVLDVVQNISLDDDAPSIAMLRSAADTIMRLERAKKLSIENRTKIMRDFASKAESAVEKAGKEAGLDRERIAQLRRDVLGVVEK